MDAQVENRLNAAIQEVQSVQAEIHFIRYSGWNSESGESIGQYTMLKREKLQAQAYALLDALEQFNKQMPALGTHDPILRTVMLKVWSRALMNVAVCDAELGVVMFDKMVLSCKLSRAERLRLRARLVFGKIGFWLDDGVRRDARP